jgi:phosphopantetheine adenylyltransferase
MASRAELPSLLLLPSPPAPSSRASLSAAYRPSISAALSKVRNPDSASKLVIAVASPFLEGYAPRTKALRSWSDVQSLQAGLYSLVAVVCAEHGVASDVGGGPGSVDVRIVLIDHDRAKRPDPSFTPSIEPSAAVIIDLPTFACAYHPWNHIIHPNSEAGYQLQSAFLKFAEGKQTVLQSQLSVVEGGVSLTVPDGPSNAASQTSRPSSYNTVCLGGTFDHLHLGHKLLLAAAALLLKVPLEVDVGQGGPTSCRYIIGVTGDALLQNKKFAEYVQSWDDRALSVIDFLATLLDMRREGWKGVDGTAARDRVISKREPGRIEAEFRGGTIRIECVEIQDPFGPTITDENVDALVVSGETRSGGKAVNDKRAAQGWKQLEVYEVDVLDATDVEGGNEATATEDFSAKISSTAIRQQRAAAAKLS